MLPIPGEDMTYELTIIKVSNQGKGIHIKNTGCSLRYVRK